MPARPRPPLNPPKPNPPRENSNRGARLGYRDPGISPHERPHTGAHPAEEIVRDRLYIGGEWVEPAGSDTIEVIDSTTEQVIGRIPEGTTEDVDRAVKAARAGFEAWREVPVEQRVEACTAISAALAERADEIAALIAAEVGMPLALARTIQAGLPAMDFGSMAQVASEVPWEEQIGNSLSCASRSAWSAASRPGTTRCTRSARRSGRR